MKTTTTSAWACLLLWAWSSRVSGSYYRAMDYHIACFVESSGVSVVAISKLVCAVRCSMTRCPYFSFSEGNCTLYDQGLASQAASRTYRKFSFIVFEAAWNKSTADSGHFEIYTGARVVDGDIDTQYHSDTITTPWWRVDLGEVYCIQTIDVLPHIGVPSWFQSAEIRAGVSAAEWDFSGYALIASFPGPYSGVGRLVFTPSGPQEARYISIQLFAAQYLNLQDVKVMVLVVEN